jgi:hypothetical protein
MRRMNASAFCRQDWMGPDHLHTTAQHGTAQHSTARHGTARHSTAQHSTAQHSTAQHSTAQHSTAQHSTAQHSTAHSKSAQTRKCCCYDWWRCSRSASIVQSNILPTVCWFKEGCFIVEPLGQKGQIFPPSFTSLRTLPLLHSYLQTNLLAVGVEPVKCRQRCDARAGALHI